MIKKIILIVLISFFSILTIYFVNVSLKRDKKSENIKNMPELSLFTLDSIPIKRSEWLKTKKNFIFLIYFSTDCDFCENEITNLKKTISSHEKNTCQFILISPSPIKLIQEFIKSQNLSHYQDITILYDPKFDFRKVFGHGTFPSTYIYNDKLHLVGEYYTTLPLFKFKRFLDR